MRLYRIFMSYVLFGLGLCRGEWFGLKHLYFYDENREDAIEYHVKGINWYGGENNNRIPEGLYVHPVEYYFNVLGEHEINSLRLPFSYENFLGFDNILPVDSVRADSALYGKSARDVFHLIFHTAHAHNMSILLDFHTIGGIITEFPHHLPEVSERDTQDALVKIVREFSKYPNFMGIDLKNEPHGSITWNEWSQYSRETIKRIKDDVQEYTGLFFVEGVQNNDDHSAWGGSFSQMGDTMNDLLTDERVVLSPHVYGVSVRGSVAISEGFPDFEKWFGFLRNQDRPVVIGEEGGMYIGDDVAWHERLKEYLVATGIRDNFYWCLNPSSIDTGGVFYDDWTTLNENKLTFMRELQSSPTRIAFPPIS